jgi:hypothetical protein
MCFKCFIKVSKNHSTFYFVFHFCLFVFFGIFVFLVTLFRTLDRILLKSYTLNGYSVTVDSDIQKDLESYLQENKVSIILTSLMERLLVSESSNPYSTIVEVLCEDYPDQGLLALELINPQKNP